jgi:hypothetical protein
MSQMPNNKYVTNPQTQVMINQYEKQYTSNQANKNPNHIRSGSQIVPGNVKIKGHAKQNASQYQEAQNPNFSSYELTPAQLAQLSHLTHSQSRLQDERMANAQGYSQSGGDRMKAKRKHNLSQQIQ